MLKPKDSADSLSNQRSDNKDDPMCEQCTRKYISKSRTASVRVVLSL